jgi:hypothetical protein
MSGMCLFCIEFCLGDLLIRQTDRESEKGRKPSVFQLVNMSWIGTSLKSIQWSELAQHPPEKVDGGRYLVDSVDGSVVGAPLSAGPSGESSQGVYR